MHDEKLRCLVKGVGTSPRFLLEDAKLNNPTALDVTAMLDIIIVRAMRARQYVDPKDTRMNAYTRPMKQTVHSINSVRIYARMCK